MIKEDLAISIQPIPYGLSLPMFPTLSREQQDYVINTILRFYNG